MFGTFCVILREHFGFAQCKLRELRLIKEPQYPGDPLRPEGALIYTIFPLQMLGEVAKIGFRTNLYHLYKPWYGILGSNAIVFEAIKV